MLDCVPEERRCYALLLLQDNDGCTFLHDASGMWSGTMSPVICILESVQ